MTTFTTEDRILAEKDGSLTVNVNAGEVTLVNKDLTDEPVAWGWYDLEIKRFFPHWDEDLMENKEGCVPLYTHPAKTLTDEEITKLHLECWDEIEFARAILRKANKK
jgi:hypothetical protein